jgi:hypothetical protein
VVRQASTGPHSMSLSNCPLRLEVGAREGVGQMMARFSQGLAEESNCRLQMQ